MNIDLLESSRERKSAVESEWRHKKQRLDVDGELREVYLVVFSNTEVIWVVKEF